MAKGSRVYDFLSNSILFSAERLADDFATTPQSEVEQELGRYREFCLQYQGEITAEIEHADDSSLSVYDAGKVDLRELTQAALYVKQYVVQDPLFRLTAPRSAAAITLSAAGVAPTSGDGALNLRRTAETLRLMKAATPMVAGGFLRFVPSSVKREDPAGIPMYASDNYFEDVLPAEILRLFKDSARVQTVTRIDNQYFKLTPLKPCRGISISFKGDDASGFMYSLHQIEQAVSRKDDPSLMDMVFSLPDTIPTPESFRVWVKQSVNQAARGMFWTAYDDASYAATHNLAFSTRSSLLFDVLGKATSTQSSRELHTANVFLNLDLPLIDDLDIAQVMQVRENEGEAFANFRFALDQKLAALRFEGDPHKAKSMAAEAIRDITETQLHDVRLKMRSIKETLGLGTAGTLVSLAAAVQTHGWSLLAAAVSAIPAANSALQYRKEVKRHPAFFLWKAMNKRGRRPRYQ